MNWVRFITLFLTCTPKSCHEWTWVYSLYAEPMSFVYRSWTSRLPRTCCPRELMTRRDDSHVKTCQWSQRHEHAVFPINQGLLRSSAAGFSVGDRYCITDDNSWPSRSLSSSSNSSINRKRLVDAASVVLSASSVADCCAREPADLQRSHCRQQHWLRHIKQQKIISSHHGPRI